jgi:hypothetical protein
LFTTAITTDDLSVILSRTGAAAAPCARIGAM